MQERLLFKKQRNLKSENSQNQRFREITDFNSNQSFQQLIISENT